MNQDRASTITNSQLKEGYKQTEVGIIPEDWECVELAQLNPFITSGSRGWADFYSEYGDPFVRITNMFRESISLDLKDLRYVNLPIGASEGKRTQLYDGDLLISITADIGIISYVDDRLQKPAYINQHIALVRFDKDKVNGKFTSYFLSHESSQKWFRGGTDQGAKAGMSLITVRKIKTAIPPLPEQEAIACTLSDIDTTIESLDRLLTKKRQIKQGAMQELLTGKRRLLGFEEAKGYKQTEIGMIPKDWKVQTLGEIAMFTNGKAHESEIKESGRYIVVNSKFISTEAEVKKYSDKCFCATLKEDILIVMSDVPNGKAIAKCFLVDKDNTYTVNQRICSLRITIENPKFIIYQLNRNPFYLRFDDGVKQTNLRRNEVLSCPLAIPRLEEQNEIANILSDMDAEIESISAKLAKTRQLKQGMMHELLTGRIRLVDT